MEKDISPMAMEFDEESGKRTQIELLTPALKRRAHAIPEELWAVPTKELEKQVDPTLLEHLLRKKFWTMYQHAVNHGHEVIHVMTLVDGLCSRQYFYKEVVEKPDMFCWFLTPPPNYDLLAAESLEFGLRRLREEILKAPMFDKKGVYQSGVANQIFQVVKFLDARVHGSPLQRIEQKNLHAHVHHNELGSKDLIKELDDIRARLEMSQAPQLTHKVPDETE
jgi:hypothetical protein